MLYAFACFFLANNVVGAQFVVRDPVKIDHAVSVRLKDGRDVEIVTRSDFSTGLPVFEVQDLLTEEECVAIRSAAPSSMMEKSLTDNDDKGQPISPRKAAKMFKDLDENRDKALDAEELTQFFREAFDLVDFTWDFLTPRVPNLTKTNTKVRKQEFIATNWNQLFADAKKLHPEWFARHSRQTWMMYSEHSFLQSVLDNVAAVIGLSESLVRETAESMQVLLYPPNGGHYSCHHDTAPDNLEDARFMTVFFFLNDVTEGGETVLFGTDLNGTFAKERALQGEEVWGEIESQCQSVASCPRNGTMPPPFSTALAVKPRRGTALFWYNMAIDSKGQLGRFYWSSIHGGCPTRSEEKWAANIWLHNTRLSEEDSAEQEL
eukprot:s226_g13.t1